MEASARPDPIQADARAIFRHQEFLFALRGLEIPDDPFVVDFRNAYSWPTGVGAYAAA